MVDGMTDADVFDRPLLEMRCEKCGLHVWMAAEDVAEQVGIYGEGALLCPATGWHNGSRYWLVPVP